MARVAATTLLLALTTGTVAACDFAAPVPGPGHFFLYNLSTGDEVDIPVKGRFLGAGCELSNLFAFDGKRFVWQEGPERYSPEDIQTVFLLELASGQRQTLKLSGSHHYGLGLGEDFLLHVSRTGNGPSQLWRYDLGAGTDKLLPIPLPSGGYTLADGQIAWRTQAPGGEFRFHVYDAATNRYVLRDRSPADLGLPKDAHLTGFGRGWLVFGSGENNGDRSYVYRVDTDKTKVFDDAPRIGYGWVHEGRSYRLDWDEAYEHQKLVVFDLANGRETEIGRVPHPSASHPVYRDGRVVLATYADVERHTHDGSSLPPVVVPFAGPILGVGAFALAVLLRRRF
jgi:hypothetical protein